MTTRRPDLHQMIRELTQPTQHHEPYTRRHKPRHHTTNNPPLLHQLDQSAMPSNNHTDDTSTIAGSRPSASLDAIDTANRIHKDATTWLTTLGYDTTGTIIDRVHRLTPAATTHHDLARDIRRWWTWARTTTGWDQPAWQPHNTCPICGKRGTLRIRLDDKLATCINDECRATWDHTTIGLLADHIRTENGEAKAS